MQSKDIVTYFGEWVRAERLRQGLSQEKLAEKASVHRTYIGMVERAEKSITLRNIGKIVNALGVTVSDVFMDYSCESSDVDCQNE